MNAGQKNYGYGRRMDWAAKQALKERYGGGHYRTVAAHLERWKPFCSWAVTQNVNDMRRIDAELVRRYGDELRSRQLSVAQRQNVISTINVIMSHASGGAWATLSPRELAGESRHTVRQEAPASLDPNTHRRATDEMRAAGMDRAAAVADLARHFGVRSREAVLADLTRWAREAEAKNAVNVIDGTKGGRDAPRWVPVTDAGRAALSAAIEARPEGSRNLLAPNESYVEARNGWIRDGRELYAEITNGDGYHDARAAYACERYRELTGYPAPVESDGRMTADGDADMAARQVIAEEMGHNRTDVITAYIGGRGKR